jgi:pimeloyl-ACP methyl ester carboxylesterase
MKRTFFNIGFSILFLTTVPALGQEDWNQFEMTQTEIINLINLPDPTFNPDADLQPLDAKTMADLGFEQVYQNSPRKFVVRDGKQLFSYVYKNPSDTTIVLLHGVLSSAYMMNRTAGLLQEATHNEVIALDFRGHGQSEGAPGDVDYINQYVHDLADVVSTIKKDKPDQRIILAGHSMGGGIILRYAMENTAPEVDGYLLIAPHLGANSPTLKEEALEDGQDPFVRLHINRIIGLKMINAIGETKYNHLPVMFFNLPETKPINQYSYRANESMYPADYKEGLSAIGKPLLVIVGSIDEAFDARKYHAAVTENSNGEFFVVEDETHNGVRHNVETMQVISNWVNSHKFQ